ncbi:MAG: hypothetical protein QOH39_3389 [Verrucomicrobiota bacterium]
MSGGDSDPMWVSLADAVSKWATTLAIVGTGMWAVFHFYLRRESQTALTIDMTATSVEYSDSLYLVNFDVCLTNKGQVAVRAERKIWPAYKDADECIDYGGDVLIRRIPPGLTANHPASWFIEDHQHSPQPNDLEGDLLRIFRNGDGFTDFWIEPGELYHVSSAYALERGSYLVMVTFIGNRGAEEFWRRVFLVQVPTPAKSSGSEPSLGGHD